MHEVTDDAPTGNAVLRFANRLIPLVLVGSWFIYVQGFAESVAPSAIVIALLVGFTTVISVNLDLEFTFGESTLEVSLGSLPMIVAAMFVHPLLGPATVMVATLLRRGGGSMYSRLANAASSGVATAATTAAVHALPASPDAAAGLLALPIAVFAVFVFEMVEMCEIYTLLEGRETGSGREFVADYRVGFGFSIGHPVLGAALVAPFSAETWPVGLAVVMGLYQLLTYGTLSMMQSEQVHRRKSEYLKDSFSRYVPASVVAELDESAGEIALGGAMCEISVMFVDIRDFTSWSETQEPDQAVAELNQLMTELAQAVFETGGTLDKYTGDGLMAFWGAPVEQPDHALHACTAAFDMLMRLDVLNLERADLGKVPFHIGIGIHSGEALVGNVGHVERLDFTAIGDTVNLAARLESATKDAGCSVLVSAATNAHLAGTDLAGLDRHGELFVKGRAEPVEAYVLVADLPALYDDGYVPELEPEPTLEELEALELYEPSLMLPDEDDGRLAA